MKVGIMSMQRVCNYGSFLQAYGLKKMIEALGHEVVFVDYRAGKPVDADRNKIAYCKRLVRDKAINAASKCIHLLFFANTDQKCSLHFKHRYTTEFLPLLGVEKKPRYRCRVDTLVIGSDEVFNCLQSNPAVGYSPELFGKDNQAGRLISYAASFGNTTLVGLRKVGKADEIAHLLKNFHAISVRDTNSGQIVAALTASQVAYNLDPVLMYDFTRENLPEIQEKDYIVVYAYRNRLSPEEIQAIKAFAQKEGKQIISIGGYQSFCDKYVEATPFEVLGYIKKADYVITDTFHGAIFSLINHKKFVAFVRRGHGKVYGNYEKLTDLLERLQLKDRACFKPEDIEKKIYEEINYSLVDKIIDAERQKAEAYLKANIGSYEDDA